MDIELEDPLGDSECFDDVGTQSIIENDPEDGIFITCCVPGCYTTSSEDYSFHSILDIDRSCFRKCKKILKLENVVYTDQICGKHFAENQFRISRYQGKQLLKLKMDAVPMAMKNVAKPQSASAIRRDIRMRVKRSEVACQIEPVSEDDPENSVPLTRSKLFEKLDTDRETSEQLFDEIPSDLEKSNQLLQELVDRLTNFSFCQCTTCMVYYNRFLAHFDKEHQHNYADEVPNETVQVEQVMNEDFDYFEAFIEKDASETEAEVEEQEVVMEPVEEKPTVKIEEEPMNLKEIHLGDIPQSEVVNTAKQVFFKVEKSGQDTFYRCTVCNKRMVYEDIAEHFKVHKNGNRPQPSYTRKSQLAAIYHKTEYQCSICEELYLMRSMAHECIQSHDQEDFPAPNGDEEQESLIPSHEMDTAGEVEIQQETELEDRLGQIANETQQQRQPELDHLPNQQGSVFNCHACDWVGKDINAHVRTVHGKKFKVLRADEAKLRYVIQCSSLKCRSEANKKLEFRNLQEAITHRRAVHSKLVDYATTKNLSRILVHPDLTETVVDCDFLTFPRNLLIRGHVCVCNCVYKQQEDAERCLAKHLGVKKFRCSYQASSRTGENTYRCKVAFYTESDLKQHYDKVHLHPDQSKVICEICGLEVLKTRLKSHTLSHRKENERDEQSDMAQCPMCLKIFVGEFRLWKHIQMIHKQNKNHMCPICRTRFVHRTDAELCKAKHAKVKTQTCHLCNEKFYTKSEKSKHNWKYHNKNGKKLNSTQIKLETD